MTTQARADPQTLNQASELTFGELVRWYRQRRGYSQQKLALLIEADATYLSKIEGGNVPPPSVRLIVRLAKALSVSPIELLAARRPMPEALRGLSKSQWAALVDWLQVRWGE